MRRRKLIGAIVLVAIAVIGWALVVRPFDTPDRRVAAYLAATAAGDERAALDAWAVFSGGIHPRPALLERRAELTRELSAAHVGTSYRTMSIEWWRTCCEPGRIGDERNAGLARIHVSAMDGAGMEHPLVFEVFVKAIAWWGDAGGERVRDWRLYEVHRESDRCVFPSSAYGCATG